MLMLAVVAIIFLTAKLYFLICLSSQRSLHPSPFFDVLFGHRRCDLCQLYLSSVWFHKLEVVFVIPYKFSIFFRSLKRGFLIIFSIAPSWSSRVSFTDWTLSFCWYWSTFVVIVCYCPAVVRISQVFFHFCLCPSALSFFNTVVKFFHFLIKSFQSFLRFLCQFSLLNIFEVRHSKSIVTAIFRINFSFSFLQRTRSVLCWPFGVFCMTTFAVIIIIILGRYSSWEMSVTPAWLWASVGWKIAHNSIPRCDLLHNYTTPALCFMNEDPIRFLSLLDYSFSLRFTRLTFFVAVTRSFFYFSSPKEWLPFLQGPSFLFFYQLINCIWSKLCVFYGQDQFPVVECWFFLFKCVHL